MRPVSFYLNPIQTVNRKLLVKPIIDIKTNQKLRIMRVCYIQVLDFNQHQSIVNGDYGIEFIFYQGWKFGDVRVQRFVYPLKLEIVEKMNDSITMYDIHPSFKIQDLFNKIHSIHNKFQIIRDNKYEKEHEEQVFMENKALIVKELGQWLDCEDIMLPGSVSVEEEKKVGENSEMVKNDV